MTFITTIESNEPPVIKTVSAGGKSAGRVYLPKAWIGRSVTVVLDQKKDAESGWAERLLQAERQDII